jgi:glycosyltransferase involved in cell wall biosynthesis
VSIIMPMHNTERFVSAALDSILKESDTAIEVIVVDDKSSDRSASCVREIKDKRICLLDGEGRGAARAMNIAFAKAGSDIIMYCDSDDLYPAARIGQQIAWLESHPECDAVCGNYSTIDSNGNLIATMQCGDIAADITDELKNGKVRTHLCTYAMRLSLVRKAGGFREFFESGYDIDFQLRCGEVGRVAYVPQNWYIYRIHSSSIIHTQSSAMRRFYEQTAYDLQAQRRKFGRDDLQRGCLPEKPIDDRSLPHSAKAHVQGLLLWRAWQEHRAGKKARGLRFGIRALATDPFQFKVWKSVTALLLKPCRVTSS